MSGHCESGQILKNMLNSKFVPAGERVSNFMVHEVENVIRADDPILLRAVMFNR